MHFFLYIHWSKLPEHMIFLQHFRSVLWLSLHLTAQFISLSTKILTLPTTQNTCHFWFSSYVWVDLG